MPVCHRDKGSYCGQAQKPESNQIDEWIKNNQEGCFDCLVRAPARKKAQKCCKRRLSHNRKFLGAQCLL